MERILPFDRTVPYNHTPMIADLMGVLLAHNAHMGKSWYFNYLPSMCIGKPGELGGNWLLPGQPFRSCELIESGIFPFEYICSHYSQFSAFIHEMIDLGYYILADIDLFYLKQSPIYNSSHFPHDVLFSGYTHNIMSP